jgi:hypothetical protein
MRETTEEMIKKHCTKVEFYSSKSVTKSIFETCVETDWEATIENRILIVIGCVHAYRQVIHNPMNTIVIINSSSKGFSGSFIQFHYTCDFTGFRNFNLQL